MSAAGVRSTRQRAAISTLLETLDDFRSAQELHDELRRRGENIGLTTVYRTLQSMASSGLVDTLHTDTGESVYRRCSEHHHHHLVCRSCGSTIEVGDHEVEAWAAEVATKHGFSDVSHTIEIFGTAQTAGARTPPRSSDPTRRTCNHGGSARRVAATRARSAHSEHTPSQRARCGSWRPSPAPKGSTCATRRRSNRCRESCIAASRPRCWTRADQSFAAQPSR